MAVEYNAVSVDHQKNRILQNRRFALSAVRRRNYDFICSVLTLCFLLIPACACAKKKVPWKTYRLKSNSVVACTFTTDARQIAFVDNNLIKGDSSSSEATRFYKLRLALWDMKTGKVEVKQSWRYALTDEQSLNWSVSYSYIKFAASGRRLIYFDPQGIRVFDVPGYTLVKRIPFSWPARKGSGSDITWYLTGFSVTPDGTRAAVALSSLDVYRGGVVRVYDLRTGRIIREWRLGGEVTYVYGVALSPDGEQVAVSWAPDAPSSAPESFIPSGMDNVRVMDVATGKVLMGVSTKYYAGPVLFGPDDTLLTGSINPERKGYKYDSVKVWDLQSGRLLREITNPRVGVHYRLSFSRDRKLLLGYIGTEKARENFVEIDSERFEIWDFASGKSVAVSPKMPWLYRTPPNFGSLPDLQFSPDGKYVLVSWPSGDEPVVYEIPQAGSSR